MRHHGVPGSRGHWEGKITGHRDESTSQCLAELYLRLCIRRELHPRVRLRKHGKAECNFSFGGLQCHSSGLRLNWNGKDPYNGRIQVQNRRSLARHNSQEHGRDFQVHPDVVQQEHVFYGESELPLDLQRNNLRSAQSWEAFSLNSRRQEERSFCRGAEWVGGQVTEWSFRPYAEGCLVQGDGHYENEWLVIEVPRCVHYYSWVNDYFEFWRAARGRYSEKNKSGQVELGWSGRKWKGQSNLSHWIKTRGEQEDQPIFECSWKRNSRADRQQDETPYPLQGL